MAEDTGHEEIEDIDDAQADAQLATFVREQGGLLETTLGDLRMELGYSRLGRWVLEEIADYLKNQDLGYFPVWKLEPEANKEPRKEQRLWLYSLDGSVRAQLLAAVLHPEDNDVFAALDGLAAGRHAALSPEQKLDLVKEIVSS